jgi:hypothetical protein
MNWVIWGTKPELMGIQFDQGQMVELRKDDGVVFERLCNVGDGSVIREGKWSG